MAVDDFEGTLARFLLDDFREVLGCDAEFVGVVGHSALAAARCCEQLDKLVEVAVGARHSLSGFTLVRCRWGGTNAAVEYHRTLLARCEYSRIRPFQR